MDSVLALKTHNIVFNYEMPWILWQWQEIRSFVDLENELAEFLNTPRGIVTHKYVELVGTFWDFGGFDAAFKFAEATTRLLSWLQVRIIEWMTTFREKIKIRHWRVGGWGQGRAPPLGPISFTFIQFSGKIWPNNRLALPFGLAPRVSEILDPPLFREMLSPTFHTTRKDSSRTCIIRLPTICASVANRYQCLLRGGSSGEQFWIGLGHQMSVLGWGLMSRQGRGHGGGAVEGGLPVWWGPMHHWIIVTWDAPLLTEWWTDTTENITFPELRRWAVKICVKENDSWIKVILLLSIVVKLVLGIWLYF